MRYMKRNTVLARYIAALDDCVSPSNQKEVSALLADTSFSTIIDIKFMFSCKTPIMLTA